jgi:hypothetical protein
VTQNLTTPVDLRNFTITEEQFITDVLMMGNETTTSNRYINSNVDVTWYVLAVWGPKVENIPDPNGLPYPEDVKLPFQWKFTLPQLP